MVRIANDDGSEGKI